MLELKKWFPIHELSLSRGRDTCLALPFWYAFTGCYTCSQFAHKAKKSAWNTWLMHPEVTEAFIQPSNLMEMDEEDFAIIQR
mgnify:CR=1 FL=1